jgi:hypothetical protein
MTPSSSEGLRWTSRGYTSKIQKDQDSTGDRGIFAPYARVRPKRRV